MKITIKNCNNIDSGEFEIDENRLNIKYAINGTGKTTIAKAIDLFVRADENKKSLIPFKYKGNSEEGMPELTGYESFKKVVIFNEKYISNYAFQQNDLLKNSFEIFIKTKNYDKHTGEIKKLLNAVQETFRNHPELDELIGVFQTFINGFGKAKSGYSKTSAIGKGIGNGNSIENIPIGLEVYKPYLRSENNVRWIKWQIEGNNYLNMADICPYCSSPVLQKKETILKVAEKYDAKAIEHLNNMLDVFAKLKPYFSSETAQKIDEISKNVAGITKDQENYLSEIKTQVENLLEQLLKLKGLNFYSLQIVDRVADELEKYKIDLTYYSHINSDTSREKVQIINESLNEVLKKAGVLQGEIAQQKQEIKNTIEMYNTEINDFLHYAGYKYKVSIVEDGSEYHLLLKHIEGVTNIEDANEYLSFGERNAFALALFMYSALKEEPDLVILDDPISSFDENKKFAIINMLFMGKRCFRNKTVLLLTHDFNTVIDTIHNMAHNFSPIPKASFLTVKKGVLQEKQITKNDIRSFSEIALINMESDMDSLNKLIYLRRYLEIQNKDGVSWQLLSNIFHKRKKPEYHSTGGMRLMTRKEIKDATEEIRSFHINDFDYNNELKKTQDHQALKEIYAKSKSNYEKLQIYRILFNENSSNKVIRKFVNETFHIENDYLFQLNPCEYDTVPQYIIDECDKEVIKEE